MGDANESSTHEYGSEKLKLNCIRIGLFVFGGEWLGEKLEQPLVTAAAKVEYHHFNIS